MRKGQPSHGGDRKIFEVMTLGSVASLLATTLYQGYPNRKYTVYVFYTYGIKKDNCITAFNKIPGVSITSFKEISGVRTVRFNCFHCTGIYEHLLANCIFFH